MPRAPQVGELEPQEPVEASGLLLAISEPLRRGGKWNRQGHRCIPLHRGVALRLRAQRVALEVARWVLSFSAHHFAFRCDRYRDRYLASAAIGYLHHRLFRLVPLRTHGPADDSALLTG